MGSHHSRLNYSIVGQRKNEIDFVRRELGLTYEAAEEEIEKVLAVFRKANLHEDGVLAFDEFCLQIKHEPTVFSESVFAFFSSSSSKSNRLTVGLKFSEFLLFTFFYLTMSENGLIEYLYVILTDKEYNPMLQDSTADPTEVKNMEMNISHMFGHAWADKRDHKIIEIGAAFDLPTPAHNHHITHAKFSQGCKNNRSLMHPVLALQVDMWGSIVDKGLWRHHKGLGDNLVRNIVRIRDKLHSIMGVSQYHEEFHRTKHKEGYHTEIKTLPTAPPHKEWTVGATGKMHQKIVHAPVETVEVEVPDETVFTHLHKVDMHGVGAIKRHETAVNGVAGHHHEPPSHREHNVAPVIEEHKPYFPPHYTDGDSRLDPLRLPQHGRSEPDLHHPDPGDPYGLSEVEDPMSAAAVHSRSMHNMGHGHITYHNGGRHNNSFHAGHGRGDADAGQESKTSSRAGSRVSSRAGSRAGSFSSHSHDPDHHSAAYEQAAETFAHSSSHDQYMQERQRVLGLDDDK